MSARFLDVVRASAGSGNITVGRGAGRDNVAVARDTPLTTAAQLFDAARVPVPQLEKFGRLFACGAKAGRINVVELDSYLESIRLPAEQRWALKGALRDARII